MLTFLLKFLAEISTPNAHIPWRWEFKNIFLRRIGMEIGCGVAIDNGFEWLSSEGVIVNEYAAIGKNVHFYNFSKIHIGRFAMFAGDVVLANGGHDKDTFLPFSGEMTIGNGVWIGTGAKIIGANLTVGDNAIVGAGAVVIDDVPPGAIVAGVPARVIGQRNLPDKVWHLGNTYFCPRTFEMIG